MSSSAVTTAGGVVVVTHVHTTPQAIDGLGGQTPAAVGIGRFSRCRPQAVGTIQIMVGLMILLFGISMTIQADTLGVYSGIFVWGSLFYVAAGSVTVAAGKHMTRALVNASLSLSVVASVVSSVAVILYSLDAGGVTLYCYSDSGRYPCYLYQSRVMGASGVLAVFNFLMLIVSVTIAAYGCSATCNCCAQPQVLVYAPQVSGFGGEFPNGQQFPDIPKSPEQPPVTNQIEPPSYCTIMP